MKAKVEADMKDAMRAKNQHLLTTIRGLLSEIKRLEIDTRNPADEAACISIVQKEIKKRKDAIEFAKKAERPELIEQNETEIKILQGYLGEQLSDQKLEELITSLVKGGADNMGKVMGALNKDYKGKFDGKTASEITKRVLG